MHFLKTSYAYNFRLFEKEAVPPVADKTVFDG